MLMFLYAVQIDNEEYGDALRLAETYNLDCDLVYQRQWRNTPVSVASIQDYLVKRPLLNYTHSKTEQLVC